MDGLNEDIDIVFVLTTNRPEMIEPALASRPGRIDLALAMPLPDGDGRARLLDLYSKRLELDVRDRARFVAATEGATPAFIREVLRRAALISAERGAGVRVTDELLSSAITELKQGADELTSTILGSGQALHSSAMRATEHAAIDAEDAVPPPR
jgi:ATP-dependent 26S proteasome regulatory subunit